MRSLCIFQVNCLLQCALQILRQLHDTKQYPNSPAVLQLHHYSWWMSSGDGTDEGLFYHPPEQDLTTFAHVRSCIAGVGAWHQTGNAAATVP